MQATTEQQLAAFVKEAQEIVREQHEKITALESELGQLKTVHQKTAQEIPAGHVESTVDKLIGSGMFDQSDRSMAIQRLSESPDVMLSCLDKMADKMAEQNNVRQTVVPKLGRPAGNGGEPADKGLKSEDAWHRSTDELSRLCGPLV